MAGDQNVLLLSLGENDMHNSQFKPVTCAYGLCTYDLFFVSSHIPRFEIGYEVLRTEYFDLIPMKLAVTEQVGRLA